MVEVSIQAVSPAESAGRTAGTAVSTPAVPAAPVTAAPASAVLLWAMASLEKATPSTTNTLNKNRIILADTLSKQEVTRLIFFILSL
jgi:hypothetical protein